MEGKLRIFSPYYRPLSPNIFTQWISYGISFLFFSLAQDILRFPAKYPMCEDVSFMNFFSIFVQRVMAGASMYNRFIPWILYYDDG
jgi:hypothetical protein